MLNNNKYSYVHNVQNVIRTAHNLDEKIKQKEKVLRLAGGSEKHPQQTKMLSDYKLEAIKAKLAILEGLSS